jgi:beta-lactamase regulating signal transducer with metallopeptidase domain
MISWLIDTLLGVTLLMLLVLAVRRPVARFFGAGWAYALWLLPPMRLLLPPLPLPQLAPDIALPPAAAFIPALGGVTASLPAQAGPGQWVPFMLALWAGGAVTFLLWHWLNYRAFLKALKHEARTGDPPSWGGIPTLATGAVDGPLAIGIFERLIVLPAHFSRRYNEGERRLALDHELVHHRRGDILWNMAGLALLAANWFNPIAWFAFHAFRSDQELACDAAVAKRASRDERHDYARALVKSASRPGLIAACPLNAAEELKHRLRMIGTHRAGNARMAGGLAAFATLLVGGLAVSNPARSIEPVAQFAAMAEEAVAPAPLTAVPAPASAIPALAASVAPRRAGPKASRIERRLAGLVLPAAGEPKIVAREKITLAGLAVEPGLPRAASFRYALNESETPVFRLARLELAPSAPDSIATATGTEPPMAAAELATAPGGKKQRLILHVEGGVIRVSGDADPVRITAVQAAIHRAMAESNDPETRANLGRAVNALELKLKELGMITTID